jgi:hypothetical protein
MINLKTKEFTSAGANVYRYVVDVVPHALSDGGHQGVQLGDGAFHH